MVKEVWKSVKYGEGTGGSIQIDNLNLPWTYVTGMLNMLVKKKIEHDK